MGGERATGAVGLLDKGSVGACAPVWEWASPPPQRGKPSPALLGAIQRTCHCGLLALGLDGFVWRTLAGRLTWKIVGARSAQGLLKTGGWPRSFAGRRAQMTALSLPEAPENRAQTGPYSSVDRKRVGGVDSRDRLGEARGRNGPWVSAISPRLAQRSITGQPDGWRSIEPRR